MVYRTLPACICAKSGRIGTVSRKTACATDFFAKSSNALNVRLSISAMLYLIIRLRNKQIQAPT